MKIRHVRQQKEHEYMKRGRPPIFNRWQILESLGAGLEARSDYANLT